MSFEISDELRNKIENIFKTYDELKNKLLLGDGYAIRQVGLMSQKGIEPEDVVEAYQSNNLDYLYIKAKRIIEMKEIYKELCQAYSKNLNQRKER